MEGWIFKKLSDKSTITDVPAYVKTILASADDIKFYIGCDSQNRGNKTSYGLVLVFHYGRRGAHVIYANRSFPRIKDMSYKLLQEAQFSISIAQELEAVGIQKPTFIDLDFNTDKKYKSNSVLQAAIGWVKSSGYTPRPKPDALVASFAGDKACKL